MIFFFRGGGYRGRKKVAYRKGKNNNNKLQKSVNVVQTWNLFVRHHCNLCFQDASSQQARYFVFGKNKKNIRRTKETNWETQIKLQYVEIIINQHCKHGTWDIWMKCNTEKTELVLAPKSSKVSCTGCLKKRVLVNWDAWVLPKHPYNQPNKLIDFNPKPWHPKARVPIFYSISLLSCVVRYKDASKGQSSLIPLNTLFLDALYNVNVLFSLN